MIFNPLWFPMFSDLEKKTFNSSLLVAGRALLNLAKKGYEHHRKSLSDAERKWNMEKCEPIESGTTMDDVIDHVRQKMHDFANKSTDKGVDDEDVEDKPKDYR